jgi:hypothetical protein
LRHGVPPLMVAEARLGEMIETLWDHRPEKVNPLMVLVLIESLRLVRRAPHGKLLLAEGAERESFDWQISHLAVLEPVISDYLAEVPQHLLAALPNAPAGQGRDVLNALIELRAEVAPVVLPLLARPNYPHADLGFEALAWSKDPRVGPWLRDWIARQINPAQRKGWGSSLFGGKPVPRNTPYRALLHALRGHPGKETEKVLLLAAQDRQAVYRAAAVSSLGWWEPVLRQEVLNALHQARRDPGAEVRQAARAALARLGERQALQWFRQALTSEDTQHVHEAIQAVAVENLTLLWPDVDRLVDADNPEVAHHAREALEQLTEAMERDFSG